MILGGIVVVALFAALIVPYFINWNDYRGTFEREAARILGHPVHVAGTASATLLPSPSLTFTDVRVGDREGQPMMTIDRFSATIELTPLLQGQIHIIAMKLERPRIDLTVDDSGRLDWLARDAAGDPLDPDTLTVQGAEISDGTLTYRDGNGGVAFDLRHVTASLEAQSLAGPWRLIGSWQSPEGAVPFQISTGRTAADGSLRVKADITPPGLPILIGADGIIAPGDNGLRYAGTYDLTEVADNGGQSSADSGWRSEGTFTLDRSRLVIDKAVLSEGPPDRPASVAGSLTVELGKAPRFHASVEAKQLDLDRSLGKGPSEPVDVVSAGQLLVAQLANLPVPPIPGSISFSVPAVVVGGAVIQDVAFIATSVDDGWQINGLRVRLPGEATIEADGKISTGEHVGFAGSLELAVSSPASFAAWWRGRRDLPAGQLVPPFTIAVENARLEPGRVSLDGMSTKIGQATISGKVAWNAAGGNRGRVLQTDLSADRIDFDQIKALAAMLVGKDVADTRALADSYQIKLASDELDVEDIVVRAISVDADYGDGALTVRKIDIGDLGGAHFSAKQGEIEDVFGIPHGHLSAHFDATTLTGLARIADRLAPSSGLAAWLTQAAPALVPVTVDAAILAPPPGSTSQNRVRITLSGSAAATNIDATLDVDGGLAGWRTGAVSFTADVKSYSAGAIAAQIGLAANGGDQLGSANLSLTASGVPASGLATTLDGNFAGLTLASRGKLILADGLPPKFDGQVNLDAPDIAPFIRMTGLALPADAGQMPLHIAGTLAALGASADIAWTDGTFGAQSVNGSAHVLQADDGGWQVQGRLALDTLDLAWLASLGLGADPLPTGDPAAPWPKTPFGAPSFGPLAGSFDVSAAHVGLGGAVTIANAALSVKLAADRIEVAARSGSIGGGTVTGDVAIHNAGGQVDMMGRIGLKGAALDTFVWQRGGRPVATGTLDLTASFLGTGRSPAGLVASLTGSGAFTVNEGEIRYVNPRAAALVINASDLGKEFTTGDLSSTFGGYIDAGTLPFGATGAAFTIAAGAVRVKDVALDAAGAAVSASAVVDLNTFTLDSDWSLTLDPGDSGKGTSGPPQVGLVFRGPVANPVRSIDLVELGSYLNIRQTERMEKMLSEAEDARLENDRFFREQRRSREESDDRLRDAQAAADFRTAADATIDGAHARREAAAAQRIADWLANAETEADAAAKTATDALSAAQAAADRATRDLAARTADEQAAIAAANDATDKAAAADAVSRATAARVAAEKVAAAAAAALTEAQAAATRAADVAAARAAAADAARTIADANQLAPATDQTPVATMPPPASIPLPPPRPRRQPVRSSPLDLPTDSRPLVLTPPGN